MLTSNCRVIVGDESVKKKSVETHFKEYLGVFWRHRKKHQIRIENFCETGNRNLSVRSRIPQRYPETSGNDTETDD
jgi:hypothetical protein